MLSMYQSDSVLSTDFFCFFILLLVQTLPILHNPCRGQCNRSVPELVRVGYWKPHSSCWRALFLWVFLYLSCYEHSPKPKKLQQVFFILINFFWRFGLTVKPSTWCIPSSAGRGVAIELVFMRVYSVRQADRAGPGAVTLWLSAIYEYFKIPRSVRHHLSSVERHLKDRARLTLEHEVNPRVYLARLNHFKSLGCKVRFCIKPRLVI